MTRLLLRDVFLSQWRAAEMVDSAALVVEVVTLTRQCPATPACFRWYGWMLPPARGEVEDRAVTEPAARFSEQPPVKRLRGE